MLNNNKKIKIIISSYDDIKNPIYGGGGAIAIHEVAKRLPSKFDVTILSWRHSKPATECVDGVNYKHIGYPYIHPKLAMFIFQIILPLVQKFIKYDIWLESFGPPFTTSALPIFTKKPVIGITHMLSAQDMYRKYKIPVGFIEKFGIKNYKHIITTTKQLSDSIIAINSKCNVEIIPNGIDTVLEAPTPKTNNGILFIGRLETNQKGIDLLIKAFSRHSKVIKDTILYIVGTGTQSEINKIMNLINEHSISDRVVLKGRLNRVEKELIFAECYCEAVSSRFESFCISALEGLAHGIPLICFDIDGLKWIPDNCAYKISPYDIDKFAELLTNTYDNNPDKYKVINNGLNYAKAFTWSSISTKFTQYLEKVSDEK